MTVQYWGDMSILIGSVEAAGHGKNFNLTVDVNPLDTTPLSTTGWSEVIGGLKTGRVSFDFMQNMAAGSMDDTFYPLLGVSSVAKSFCTPSADGSLAYTMIGVPLSYTPLQGAVGELAMGHIEGQASGAPMVRGLLIHPGSASRTSSSTGTGQQIGAVGATQSLYAALHVLSVAGTATPTVTVKVQSDDNASFTSATDRITFTAATAVGYQWGSVAGAVADDYWRVSYTISGTNPVFSFAVVAGIA